MKLHLIILCILSVLFYILWQYLESAWLILIYTLAMLSVCISCFITEKRKAWLILSRFEKMLMSDNADYISDENMTATERKLITHLCELETREAKIKNGFRNISSLVADIAHQSKTPLSAILMYTEMNDCGEVIRSQTEKLKFLIESLTKLAKCEGGLISENLTPKENSVKESVQLAVESNYSSADSKSIDI